MEIGALSSVGLSSAMNNEIGVSVLKMAMDSDDKTANAMQKMLDSAAMERSVNPSVGGLFDMSV
ncbi:MAG: YjfB family protein [Lachnospiraceae bacterium]|nr:YjfB family protein [Lachnospiraceae bacterium]